MDQQIKYIQSLKNVIFSKLIHFDMIKTGTFTLKNGTQSNIYMDLRQLVNYPQLFSYLTKLLYLEYPQLLDIVSHPDSKLIPIPLGGLPLGFHLSSKQNIPLLMIRDKIKDHGTKRMIEGVISSRDQYILIEDVITSGSSIIQTLDNISGHLAANSSSTSTSTNPNIPAIICICNRGNIKTLRDIPVFSIFTLEEIQDYISNSLVNISKIGLSYFNYGTTFSNKLYQLALIKKSNIILSCDFMTTQEILDCLQVIGSSIIALKLHLDILQTPNYSEFITDLNTLKASLHFLIIEDAKYADIDSIMIAKINNSQLEINRIADAFTMHAIAGLNILEGNKLELPGIVVAEMSSSNNMISTDYTRKIINTIRENKAEIHLGGLVCQTQIPGITEPFEIATISPGINLDSTHDEHNQNYKIPKLTMSGDRLGLFWIVGRGITIYKNNHEKLIEKMDKYKSLGWDYFIKY
jgi:uridine monophosphate synthetase